MYFVGCLNIFYIVMFLNDKTYHDYKIPCCAYILRNQRSTNKNWQALYYNLTWDAQNSLLEQRLISGIYQVIMIMIMTSYHGLMHRPIHPSF